MNEIVAAALRRMALVLAVLLAAPAWAADGAAYTLAILPSAPAATMNGLWTPFVKRLSKSTGLEFRLKHYQTMDEFERDVASGAPDFTFSSPIQAAAAHVANGYVPLVRARKPVAIGLFVRSDSPIRRVEDLAGRKISFVGNKNICSVAMQRLLAGRKESLAFDREYAGSTRNVIINILRGKTDAGAIFLPDMDGESADTHSQLREVLQTPPISPHPLSANPRIARKVREVVAKAVIGMAASPDGAELLRTLRLENPVLADYRRDYAELEQMEPKGSQPAGTPR